MGEFELFEKIKESLIVLGYRDEIKTWNDLPPYTIDDLAFYYRKAISKPHTWYLEVKDEHIEAKKAFKFLENLFEKYRLDTLRDIIPKQNRIELVKTLSETAENISEKMKTINNNFINERKENMKKLLKETRSKNETAYLRHYITQKKLNKKLKQLKKKEKKKKFF